MLKKTLVPVLMLVLLLAVPAAALENPLTPVTADSQNQNATLTVIGKAVVQLEPDYAMISLGATSAHADVSKAQVENATLVEAILQTLFHQGIPREDMETSSFTINPIYQYKPSSLGSEQSVSGYEVTNVLQVTVRDISALGSVIDAAISAGANLGYGLYFDSNQRGPAYDKALQLAAEEAQRKAGVLASAVGRELDGIAAALEQTADYSARPAANGALSVSDTRTPILSGQLSVEAAVELSFYLK